MPELDITLVDGGVVMRVIGLVAGCWLREWLHTVLVVGIALWLKRGL